MIYNGQEAVQHFETIVRYTDRQGKAAYVWQKYRSLLTGRSILDVGADECFLKQYLDTSSTYWGIGLGGHPDQQVNLEIDKIPFDKQSYDVALCLDVLEHIENPHEIFDELCRVTRNNVIISLPNAWGDFYRMMRHGYYNSENPFKYYGLPVDHPGDRHKWFFSVHEAHRFLKQRGEQNKMRLIQFDYSSYSSDARTPKLSWLRPRYLLRKLALRHLIHSSLNLDDFYAGTIWAVLEHEN